MTAIAVVQTIFVVRAIVVTQTCVLIVTASLANVNQSVILIPNSAAKARAVKTGSAA